METISLKSQRPVVFFGPVGPREISPELAHPKTENAKTVHAATLPRMPKKRNIGPKQLAPVAMYKSTPGSGKVINPQYKEWLKEERKRQTLLRRAEKQAKKEREREKKALIARGKEERDRGSDPAHIPVDADCPVEEMTPL